MNMNPPLSGAHLRTHEKIFKHPMSHNLTWREVRSLFGHIGEVAEESNGVLKVTRNGQTDLFRIKTLRRGRTGRTTP